MSTAEWIILVLGVSIPVWVWVGIQIGMERGKEAEHRQIMLDREWDNIRKVTDD